MVSASRATVLMVLIFWGFSGSLMSKTAVSSFHAGTMARLPKMAMPAPLLAWSPSVARCSTLVMSAGSARGSMGCHQVGMSSPCGGLVMVGKPKSGWGWV